MQRLFHLHSRYIVQIHFELVVSLILALEATELVSQSVAQMAVELINKSSHFSTEKEMSVKATFFFM